MDKQFIRILMLSALLPAGAALAQAIEQEHLRFAVADRPLLGLQAAPLGVAVDSGLMRTVATHRDRLAPQRRAAGGERP